MGFGLKKTWKKLVAYLRNVDLDHLFAYRADKEVKVLDRKLGLTSLAIQVGVLLYILVYVFIVNEGYLA